MLSLKNKIPLFIVFFVLNSITTILFAIEISVSTDRNPVHLNESVQITFTANAEPSADPDFSPLEKDFTILNQSQQQSTQIINWKKTASYQWILNIMAKRTGNLVIPAINFGKDSSPFSSLIVNKVQVAGNSAKNEDLFLQVRVDNARPYIQEQLIYTLKLYRRVNISQASLSEPALENAVIEKLGEDKNYNIQYQGENYVVTERNYAIFPQESGIINIAPLELTANVIIANQRRSNRFFNRQSTRIKRVTSEEITLEVQPKPANITGHWLPVQDVNLQETWPDNAMQMTVGEPYTRTITLYAKGATVSGLPELYTDNMPAHLKAYPDQPMLKENAQEAGMVALREEKIALIPSQAGTYVLPAIEVPWWNTNTQQMEIARIPERSISAIAVAGAVEKHIPGTVATTPLAIEQTESAAIVNQQYNSLWFWLTLFFASAWLATLIYFLSRKTGLTDSEQHQGGGEKTLAINKILKQACTNSDPIMAKDALLQWGREKFKQSSLNKIAQHCSVELQNEILSLNTVLYSDTAEEWQGSVLWSAFQKNKSADTEKNEPLETLPALFKI